jgi:hypothetical protein
VTILSTIQTVEAIGAEPVLFPFGAFADVHFASNLRFDVTRYRSTTVDEANEKDEEIDERYMIK